MRVAPDEASAPGVGEPEEAAPPARPRRRSEAAAPPPPDAATPRKKPTGTGTARKKPETRSPLPTASRTRRSSAAPGAAREKSAPRGGAALPATAGGPVTAPEAGPSAPAAPDTADGSLVGADGAPAGLEVVAETGPSAPAADTADGFGAGGRSFGRPRASRPRTVFDRASAPGVRVQAAPGTADGSLVDADGAPAGPEVVTGADSSAPAASDTADGAYATADGAPAGPEVVTESDSSAPAASDTADGAYATADGAPAGPEVVTESDSSAPAAPDTVGDPSRGRPRGSGSRTAPGGPVTATGAADEAGVADGSPGTGRWSADAHAAPHTPAPGFFGRQRELKALHTDIERAGLNTIAGRKAAHTRVLLIAGQRGSGRTALARELARQVGRRYPDGVLHIRLSEPGGEPVPVERTARDLLGEFDIPVPPGAGEDELSAMVREALAVRRVLLLLDDAHDAEQVDLLLPENPDCLVVAVARGPLTGIPDIRPCTIGGLDAKAAIDLLGTFSGSVRITVDPQAAESLAEECGGQPAALAVVGGWLATHPMISVADIAKRLRAVPEDHEQPQGARPLARAFRFVYEGLPSSTAGMLRLLALAPAGFADAHTASALAGCSVSAARALLDDLAALNLLRPAGEQFEIPGSLAPLMRALMEAYDRPAEVQLARARMLERTVRLLQSCRAVTEPEGSPARKKLAALPRAVRFSTAGAAADWLSSRRPALLASARLAVADGELDTLARRLVSALVRALAAHQGTDAAAPDLYGLHQLVLGVAERQGLHREEAAALLNIGDLDARTGRTYDALARYRSALDAGRAANDHYATGRAMESVGGAYEELQDWHRAADWYGRALAQRLSRGERAEEARLYGRLGTVHTYAGRYGEALRHWRAAAAGYRRLQDVTGQARALSEAARVQEYAGRPEESLHICQEAVEWARRGGDIRLQAALELRLADTLDRLGDPTAARLHRDASDRLLSTAPSTNLSTDSSAYEIRSTSAEG